MTKRNQKSVRVQCILILVNCYCWRSSLAMISLRTLGGLRYFFFCALSPYLMSFKGYVCIHIVHVLNLSIIRRILPWVDWDIITSIQKLETIKPSNFKKEKPSDNNRTGTWETYITLRLEWYLFFESFPLPFQNTNSTVLRTHGTTCDRIYYTCARNTIL